MCKDDKKPSVGQSAEEIVMQYANEYFTEEMLLSGDETWDLSARAWLDEHYPDVSDDIRQDFGSLLDQRYHERKMLAFEEKLKEEPEPEPDSEEPVYEGMTKRELLAKTRELAKSQNYLEASLLMKVYKGL